jgi:hypothetical protein
MDVESYYPIVSSSEDEDNLQKNLEVVHDQNKEIEKELLKSKSPKTQNMNENKNEEYDDCCNAVNSCCEGCCFCYLCFFSLSNLR